MQLCKLMSLILMSGLVILLSSCSKKPVMDTEQLSAPAVSEASTDTSPTENVAASVTAGASLLESVYFDYDSPLLSPQAQQILARNAALLQESDLTVTIEGHCDERGSDEYNLALGEQRAASVKNYLVTLGVAAARLSTISYGEERPVMVGNDESAWANNRRAAFN